MCSSGLELEILRAVISRSVHKDIGGHHIPKSVLTLRGNKAKVKGHGGNCLDGLPLTKPWCSCGIVVRGLRVVDQLYRRGDE